MLEGIMVKKTHTIATETRNLYTVTGLVIVRGIVGVVTTAMTVANTLKLQVNPTTGTNSDLCAATDLGTTDTPAGNLLSIGGAPTGAVVSGIGAVQMGGITKVSSDFLGATPRLAVNAGTIDAVVTGTNPDGVIDWYLLYVPLSNGASVAAA